MKRSFLRLVGSLLLLALVSCAGGGLKEARGPSSDKLDKHGMSQKVPKDGLMKVRTTAYTHTEADSLQYGRKTAAGTILSYGKVKSAAADWSRFPYGTIFQIQGDKSIYQIDDYGSALVGTSTIDIYKPSKGAMRNWGVRHVDIKILRWGSYQKSLAIMKARTKAKHVHTMVSKIRSKLRTGIL